MSNWVRLNELGVELPPYVPAERIAMDMQRLGTIASLGFFQREVSLTTYHGPTTQYHPSIVGHEGGVPIAGMQGHTEEAPLSTYRIDSPAVSAAEDDVADNRKRLTIRLNLPEIEQRLAERHAVLREPEPWIPLLRSGIKQAMSKAALKNHHMSFGSIQYVGMVAEYFGISLLLERMPGTVAAHLLATPALVAAVENVREMIDLRRAGRPLKEGRFLVYAVPPYLDSSTAVVGLSKVSRLVKALK